MKKVFVDILPTKKFGERICIDWESSVGKSFNFIYEDLQGEITILNYFKQKRTLTLKYLNFEKDITTTHLLECKIGNLIKGINNKQYQYEIGQNIKNYNRDITIVGREIRKKKSKPKENEKWYKYHCNKCGNEDWIREECLKEGRSKYICNVCCSSPQKVLKGSNDIATTDPWMCDYIINEEDWYKYNSGSNASVKMKCIDCGNIKEYKISYLKRYRKLPCECSDNIPYTEKFMFDVLKQLNINLIFQLSKKHLKWCKNYKYDFYFKLDNEEYIVETHGKQHYINSRRGRSLKEEQENDKYKYELAISNGIKPENYIVIDCRKSESEWIKNSILNSRLNDIFNLNNINWIECEEYALKNIVKEVCDYYNKDYSIEEIEDITKISKQAIYNHLRKGAKIGICKYKIRKRKGNL